MDTNEHQFGRGRLTSGCVGEDIGSDAAEDIRCCHANQGIVIGESICQRRKNDVCADVVRYLAQNADGEESPWLLRISQGIRQCWNCCRANAHERERCISGGLWGGLVLHQCFQKWNGSCGIRAEYRKTARGAPRPDVVPAKDESIPGFVMCEAVRELAEQIPAPLWRLTLNPFQQVRQCVGSNRANSILSLFEIRRVFGHGVLAIKREPSGEASAVVARFVIAADDREQHKGCRDAEECSNDGFAARQWHVRIMEALRD